MENTFKTALKKTFDNEVSTTENGATGFATTSSKLLDIHFATSSLRDEPEEKIASMFADAYMEDPMLAVKWMFMCRDIRSGMGERRTFRTCFKWLANYHTDVAIELIDLISEYGRWDDLLCLISFNDKDVIENEVIRVIAEQLASDVESMKMGDPVSLLAKWLPSCNTSSIATRRLGRYICSRLSMSEKKYRKTLSALRKRLNIVETKASANEWSKIDYNTVPSLANIKYNKAFYKHDEKRRSEYLDELMSTDGSAKINASACFPSDIVSSYTKNAGWAGSNTYFNPDPALEAMWKSLPNMCINGNVLCVVDGSGSMTTCIGNATMMALDVANALGIYCSEHLTGPFKDKFITFSSKPQYVDLSNADSLAEKLEIAYAHDECSNTNLEATFDLILQTATANCLKQEDIPTVVILSDMEFDCGIDVGKTYFDVDGTSRSNKFNAAKVALMEKIRAKWQEAGYKLPRLIWWNICSRTKTVPMQQNDLGVVMCSGFSQTQFKMLASNKTDPYEVLVDTLNSKRYQLVEDAIKSII